MDSIDLKIEAKLHEQFSEIKGCAQSLSSSVFFYPNDPYSIFRFDKSDNISAHFECKPLLLIVPEKPMALNSDLHIVVQGHLEIDKEHLSATGQFRTRSFGSKVGYFRMKADSIDHVYGAHFDIDLQNLSHPAFHGQMASFEEFKDTIQSYYESDLPKLNNPMQHILRNARIPTAQMDFFSFLMQVIADHLLAVSPSQSHRSAFMDLLTKSKALMGSGFLHPAFQAPNSALCYRSGHWYE